jgi:hypothetical protein
MSDRPPDLNPIDRLLRQVLDPDRLPRIVVVVEVTEDRDALRDSFDECG